MTLCNISLSLLSVEVSLGAMVEHLAGTLYVQGTSWFESSSG